jgi:hypothetical protein
MEFRTFRELNPSISNSPINTRLQPGEKAKRSRSRFNGFPAEQKTVETVSSSALLHAPGSSPVLMQIAGLPVQSA